MILALGLALLALAREPQVCEPPALERLAPPPDRLAVAWVGPWWRRPRGALRVVVARDLAAWVAAQDPAWTGRTLQRLGLRRRNTDPGRRYQVVVFDVPADALCRPTGHVAEGEPVAGTPACARRLSKPDRGSTGCGETIDRRTGEPGFELFVVPRRVAARDGYCAVPLDRYLRQAGR
jgi:hypothetical protein